MTAASAPDSWTPHDPSDHDAQVEREFDVQTFATQDELHAWLTEHGTSTPGLYVRLAKKGADVATINWEQLVEVLLCHGWIDGRTNRYDDAGYTIRVTPRRARSIWSQKNVDTVSRLIAEGRMRPAGLTHVQAAQADGRWDAAYGGSASMEVPADLVAALDAAPGAQAAFDALNRTERYAILFRVQTAAKPATRAARITRAVDQLKSDDRRSRLHTGSPVTMSVANRLVDDGISTEELP